MSAKTEGSAPRGAAPAGGAAPPAPPARDPHSGASWNSHSPARSRDDERSAFQLFKSRVVRLAPKPIVRLLARPYIAGETREEALALVRQLHETKGLCSTVDVLGEAIRDANEARAMLDEYVGTLEALGRCDHANISIKLSALGQGLDDDLCARNLEVLLSRAASLGQFVRFDMEDHPTVDSTLRYYREFVGRYPRIGVVLQSRLFRTPDDIRALAPLKPNVRLCIGIYREPKEIAFTDKPSMKRRLLELLETMWGNGQYVAIATHDEAVVRAALEIAHRRGVPRDAFEIQMLLGVPRGPLQAELRATGVKVRLYVPYGRHWYQYCLRRIEHNPGMASLVLKNLLGVR